MSGRTRDAVAAGLALLVLTPEGLAAPFAAPLEAERPREYVDTTPVAPAGRTLPVSSEGDLQAALDAARPGDVIILEAGATFTGPFTLRRKPGSDWITIRPSTAERSLPAGTRADPSHAAAMATLVAGRGPVLTAEPGAHHYRFERVEIHPSAGTSLPTLVLLGQDETSLEDLPHHIIFDRCYLHGDPSKGSRRGIAMNGRHMAVVDSHLSDFKVAGQVSQAVLGWSGAGPFKLVNNYLEAAGENVLFGGRDPRIPRLVPSDIEVRRNHFAKSLAWRAGDPRNGGTPWTVKTLLVLRNARRVLIEGNLFEYNWAHAQQGFAIEFTVRNQGGKAPWSVVEDVTFINNIVRHTGSGVSILGLDEDQPSQRGTRILIRNNLFDDVNGGTWGGAGVLFQLLRGTSHVVIEQNTALQSGPIIMADGLPHTGFVFRANIAPHNLNGIFGSGSGPGLSTLKTYFPDSTVKHNVIVGGDSNLYPPGNFFPAVLDEVGFADRAAGDYRVTARAPFRTSDPRATAVPGVDFTALCAADMPTPQPQPFCERRGAHGRGR